MRLPESLTGLLHRQRPVLRVQLALLYSGVFVGLVVVLFLASSVLFSTANVFFGHSQMVFHPGAAAAARQSAAGPQFTPWPFLLALAAIAVGVLAAWWLAGRFLRPLRSMTTAAQQISATNLDRRLSLEGPMTSSPSSVDARHPVRTAAGVVRVPTSVRGQRLP